MQSLTDTSHPPDASSEADPEDRNRLVDHSTPMKPTRTRHFIVQLGCLLCSRELGVFDTLAWPVHGPVVLVQPDGSKMQIADWHRLRCDNCGGSVLPGEITVEDDRGEPPHDWSEDRPRRGRPPKRLVEQRSQNGSTA